MAALTTFTNQPCAAHRMCSELEDARSATTMYGMCHPSDQHRATTMKQQENSSIWTPSRSLHMLCLSMITEHGALRATKSPACPTSMASSVRVTLLMELRKCAACRATTARHKQAAEGQCTVAFTIAFINFPAGEFAGCVLECKAAELHS